MIGLRVLHVYRTYFPDPPGGLQEAIRQIALSTRSFGIKARIFALSPNNFPAEIERPEGRIIRCRSWAAPASCDLGGVSAFMRFAESAEWADVIHYHFPWPFADLLHQVTKPRAPAVLTYHSDVVRQRWLGKIYAPLMHGMFRATSAVVATSPAYAVTSPILSEAEIHDKVHIIPLGIVESSYPSDGDNSVFARIGLADEEPYFFFIGVLRYYKGLHTLVQAARRVGAKLVVAGSGPEGGALKQMTHELGASNVLFAGQVTDEEKVALIKRCRAMVLPSHLRSEAFGMVLVEAAMLGRPMVSCEIGTGTSYVNLDGETGFVVPPENPDALASALQILLNDYDLVNRFGLRARARYDSFFSGPALGSAYANLYRQVARG